MPDQKKPGQTARDKRVSALDTIAKSLLTTIDPGYAEREILSKKDRLIQSIIDDELTIAKGVSGGSIIDFATKMASTKVPHQKNDGLPDADPSDIFTKDLNSIFGYYQANYQNRYIELADLKFISKFIPALGEAVKTTLDSIVSSDDMSTSITRNLVFGANLTDEEKRRVTTEIERIEKDEKLLKRLRNTVYKKALISGQHYVYCPSYAKLFEEYDRLLKMGKIQNGVITMNYGQAQRRSEGVKDGFNLSSATESTSGPVDMYAAMEACSFDSIVDSLDKEFTETEKKKIKSNMENGDFGVYTCQSPFLTEAIEAVAAIDYYKNDLTGYANNFNSIGQLNDSAKVTADGTVDVSDVQPAKFNTTGTYLKFIDANRVVPVKVYNQIVGYFYVHDTTASKKASSIMTQTNSMLGATSLFAGLNMKDDKKDSAVRSIVNSITDGILSNFSNQFVNQNSDHKKLIADCIISNGLVNNSLQIQFIPATDMVPFIINEDEEGFGQSILADSLFPGRLLLDLIISKLLLYMNKSGSKTYAYVRKGPIDVNSANHTQRVLRQLQEQNITFGDLLSSQMAFAKFAPYGNIQLPTARNGDHLVDFEVQDGQNIDLKTDFEDWLEKMAIMGSGVPSVILEYTDAADYAKSIVTANIKFAGRVATLQSDLEDPTTEVYKRLIANSNLDESLKSKVIPNFEFKLPRPRVNANANMSDFLSQMQSFASMMADITFGSDESTMENFQLVREEFIRKFIMEYLPFFDWKSVQDMIKAAQVSVALKIKEKDKTDENAANGNMDIDDALLDDEELQ